MANFENIGGGEAQLANNEPEFKARRRRNNRGSGISHLEEKLKAQTANSNEEVEAEELKAEKPVESDPAAIETITPTSTEMPHAEKLARLRSIVEAVEQRTNTVSPEGGAPFIAHNPILERQTDGKKLKAVRERLKIEKKPLVLDRAFDDEKPATPVEAAQRADQKYLDAYKSFYSKKNEFLGMHVQGKERLQKFENEMLSARRQSLLEREAIITDPAERARLRREEAKALVQLKSQARIEAAQQEGRWDQKVFEGATKWWGNANQKLEAKYGSTKARVIRAAAITALVTGSSVVALGLTPAASFTAFSLLLGAGATRFVRSVAAGTAGAWVGSKLGGLYKNTIGEKQRAKSEKRLDKLDVHGELSNESLRDFLQRFEKNYNRAQDATLQKKMSWVKTAGALAVGGAVAGYSMTGGHEVLGHGGGGHGGNGGGHSGGPHAPGAKAVAGHPNAPANGPVQHAGVVEKAAAPEKPVIHTDRLSIGDKLEGVKMNDANKLLGHFAEKLQKDYPDMSKAPPSVRQFLNDFNTNQGESVLHGEDRMAKLLGFENKHLLMHDGDSIELNNEGQIVFKFANAKDALHAPHVLYDNVHDTAQPTTQFDEIAKQHAARVGARAGASEAAAHHAAERHTTGTHKSPERIMRDEVVQSHEWTEAHTALIEEHAKLMKEYAARPKETDPSFDRWNKMYADHSATYQKHLKAFNEKYGTLRVVESTSSIESASSTVKKLMASTDWQSIRTLNGSDVMNIAPPDGTPEAAFRGQFMTVVAQSHIPLKPDESVGDYFARVNATNK